MIPIEIEKWRFAKKLFPDKSRNTASNKLNVEINHQKILLQRLQEVGYKESNKMLRLRELLIIMEHMCLSEDFFD